MLYILKYSCIPPDNDKTVRFAYHQSRDFFGLKRVTRRVKMSNKWEEKIRSYSKENEMIAYVYSFTVCAALCNCDMHTLALKCPKLLCMNKAELNKNKSKYMTKHEQNTSVLIDLWKILQTKRKKKL